MDLLERAPALTRSDAEGLRGGRRHGKRLYADLIELVERYNPATDGTVALPSAYVEVIARR